MSNLNANGGGTGDTIIDMAGLSWPMPPAVIDTAGLSGRTVDAINGVGNGGASVDVSAAQRIEAFKREMVTHGFAPQSEFYAPGTVLFDGAADTFQRIRNEWEALPLAEPAMGKYIDTVRAEKRADHVIPVASILMRPDGSISTDSEMGIVTPTDSAYRRMMSLIGPAGSGSALSDPMTGLDYRALMTNYYARKADAGESITFRTRYDAAVDARKVWAIVSSSYGKFDGADGAQTILDSMLDGTLPSGARAEVTYDGFRTRIDLSSFNPIAAKDVRVGEGFRAGVSATTADDGSEAWVFQPFVWRVRCRNVSTLRDTGPSKRRVHKGKRVGADVLTMLREASASVAPFMNAWQDAEKDNVLAGDDDARAKLSKLCERGLIKVPGVTAENMFARVYAAWQKEPGYSRAAVANAVSRAAHDGNRWVNPWAPAALEALSGDVVYNYVKVG